MARSLAQQQQYAEAVQKYQAILEQKPNIEEVKWELCKVYIPIEDYEEASILLEGLLESDSGRIEYLLSGGKLAFLENRYEQGSELLRPGRLKLTRMEYMQMKRSGGWLTPLSKAGQDYAAIPLMEQVVSAFID